jgi:hypothetical protein
MHQRGTIAAGSARSAGIDAFSGAETGVLGAAAERMKGALASIVAHLRVMARRGEVALSSRLMPQPWTDVVFLAACISDECRGVRGKRRKLFRGLTNILRLHTGNPGDAPMV